MVQQAALRLLLRHWHTVHFHRQLMASSAHEQLNIQRTTPSLLLQLKHRQLGDIA